MIKNVQLTSSVLSTLFANFFLLLSPCLAAESEKNTQGLPPVDLTASFFSMFKGLAICIALLLVVIWVLKKIKAPIVTGQGRKLKIIERLPVSARSSLLLVQVENRQMLVGVGADPVSLVSDFINSDSEQFEINSPVQQESSEKKGESGE